MLPMPAQDALEEVRYGNRESRMEGWKKKHTQTHTHWHARAREKNKTVISQVDADGQTQTYRRACHSRQTDGLFMTSTVTALMAYCRVPGLPYYPRAGEPFLVRNLTRRR